MKLTLTETGRGGYDDGGHRDIPGRTSLNSWGPFALPRDSKSYQPQVLP
jgi:hypothetical protein